MTVLGSRGAGAGAESACTPPAACAGDDRAGRGVDRRPAAGPVAGDVRRVGPAARPHRQGRTRRRLRVGQHGASAVAGEGGQGCGRSCCSRATGCVRSPRRRRGVTTANLLDRMLDPTVGSARRRRRPTRRATTPGQLFEKAEALRPGSFAALSAKAKQLTGGPDSPPPPTDRSVYGVLVAEGKADVFLTYCTNALTARRENPHAAGGRRFPLHLRWARITAWRAPGARGDAHAFALFILSSKGSGSWPRQGFAAPNLP